MFESLIENRKATGEKMIKLTAKKLFNAFPLAIQNSINKKLNRGSFRDFQAMRYIENTDGYSLKPFDDYQCIFVRIPKCATRSVSKTLFGNLGGGHISLKKYSEIFSPVEFENYFKFCIVRNPWDRLASAFFFLQNGGITDEDKMFFQKHLSAYKNFEYFVKDGLSLAVVQSYIHFRPQVSFVYLTSDQLGVNFVGYYENLEQDFYCIREKIGIRKKLLSLNRNGSRKDYREYFSNEMIEIVASIYKEDIKAFGYNFDNSSIPFQVAKRLDY